MHVKSGEGVIDGVRVRAMTEADVPDVLRIERASFAVPWTLATFLGLLRRTDAHLFVAEVERETGGSGGPGGGVRGGLLTLVGYAVVWVVVDQAELGDLAVDPEWRRRGIGQRLLDAVLERARGQGVRELFLEVRSSNVDAQRLYRSNGFADVGRRRNYYSRPREDALVLRRWVP